MSTVHALDCDLGDDCLCSEVSAVDAPLALVTTENGTPDDSQALDTAPWEPVGHEDDFTLWLGTTSPNWLEKTDVPLFLSRRTLGPRKSLPVARGRWALDSGGFSELNLYGEWRTSEDEYVADVKRFQAEIGSLEWVAPQDWMCEPFVCAKTGMDVRTHQVLTVQNFLRLRDRLGPLVVPVLQGWTRDEYLWCVGEYDHWGVDLFNEPVVALGSVCRRQNMAEAGKIVRSLVPLRLHGFGVKILGLRSFGDVLVSADSMAWSYRARAVKAGPNAQYERLWKWCCGTGSGNCSGCINYALRWREIVLGRFDQLRLEIA